MSWTTPITAAAGDVLSATNWNTYVRDNPNYLLNRPYGSYKRTAGNYTTTSTSLADIDATNLNLSITMSGGVALVTFMGQTSNTTNADYAIFELLVDGSAYSGGSAGLMQTGLAAQSIGGTIYPVQFTLLIPSLSVGAHTFKMQWKTANGNTQTLYGDGTTGVAHFGVVEVG